MTGGIRVERGDPDPAEIAALVVALELVLGRAREARPAGGHLVPVPAWSDPRRALGVAPAPGAGHWRAAA